jgi:hypothetical protein
LQPFPLIARVFGRHRDFIGGAEELDKALAILPLQFPVIGLRMTRGLVRANGPKELDEGLSGTNVPCVVLVAHCLGLWRAAAGSTRDNFSPRAPAPPIGKSREIHRMGRYAFFNTEFEYKFAFAIQSSVDMVKFAGSEEGIQGGDAHHQWDREDIPFIKRSLDDLQGILTEKDIPDFGKYQKTLKGTEKLHADLRDAFSGVSDDKVELMYEYILGCLIYHQLMYQVPLTVKYEF